MGAEFILKKTTAINIAKKGVNSMIKGISGWFK